jgi:hypothetical protein
MGEGRASGGAAQLGSLMLGLTHTPLLVRGRRALLTSDRRVIERDVVEPDFAVA